MDLRNMTPAEIDSKLAELYYQQDRIQAAIAQARDSFHYKANDHRDWRGFWGKSWGQVKASVAALADAGVPWEREAATRLLAQEARLRAELQACLDEQAPYHAEYDRRPWTRAFLVVSSGTGHVHSSMSCSTCYPTTRYHWRPELSGAPEAEIIAQAGERACTICYPNAPVAALASPSRIFTAEELAAKAERERRAARGPKPRCPNCGIDRPRTKATDRGEQIDCSECTEYAREEAMWAAEGRHKYAAEARAKREARAAGKARRLGLALA